MCMCNYRKGGEFVVRMHSNVSLPADVRRVVDRGQQGWLRALTVATLQRQKGGPLPPSAQQSGHSAISKAAGRKDRVCAFRCSTSVSSLRIEKLCKNTGCLPTDKRGVQERRMMMSLLFRLPPLRSQEWAEVRPKGSELQDLTRARAMAPATAGLSTQLPSDENER